MTRSSKTNAVFQSEHHPLVVQEPRSREQLASSLIHLKAYATARSEAKGLRVLEVGCNTGYGTQHIAETAREVWAIDVSERAISAARGNAAADNIHYELADGSSLVFGEEEFDLVVSFQVIEHVEDVPHYLSEIARVLKPGGRALFTTPNGTLRLNPGRPPWNVFHVREYAGDELEAELSQHFGQVRVVGLFGEDDLHDTERRRIERAKRIGRHRTMLALKRLLLTHLPEGALVRLERLIARLGRGRRGSPDIRGSEPDWTLDCLHYRESGIDAALDLLAICTKTE